MNCGIKNMRQTTQKPWTDSIRSWIARSTQKHRMPRLYRAEEIIIKMNVKQGACQWNSAAGSNESTRNCCNWTNKTWLGLQRLKRGAIQWLQAFHFQFATYAKWSVKFPSRCWILSPAWTGRIAVGQFPQPHNTVGFVEHDRQSLYGNPR